MGTSPSFRCETYEEAVKEVRSRKSSPDGQNMLHRILVSPYGNGYIVRSIDAELYCESIANGQNPDAWLGSGAWSKGAATR